MAENDFTSSQICLDPGFVPVPVFVGELNASVRICVVTRLQPDPVSGAFVVLRRTFFANVLLGCLTDALGDPVEWVELWIQNSTGASSIQALQQQNFTGARADVRWREFLAEKSEADPCAHIGTAWESAHPLPIWIDRTASRPVNPAGGAGESWRLCVDDALLTAAGLPPYSTSPARYLHLPGAGGKFVPVTESSPRNERTDEIAAAIPEAKGLAPLNVECGMMAVFRFAPLGLEELADALGGTPWKGIENGRKPFRLGGPYRALENETEMRNGVNTLFSASAGASGRLAESLHLKLLLLVRIFRAVKAHTKRSQLPMLNLSAESFRASLSTDGFGIPLLWTAGVVLARPGQAEALQIQSSDFRYFQSVEALAPTIYRPGDLAVPREGIAGVRIRKATAVSGGVCVEATLSSQERIAQDETELIWLQVPTPSGKVDLYGYLSAGQAMAAGESVFRSIPLALSPTTLAALEAAAGAPFSGVPFAILPRLSSAVDLYSLAVVALRIFVVNAQNSLPLAVDAAMSLARQMAEGGKSDEAAGERIARLAGKDARWLDALGPRHLRTEDLSAEEAEACLPMGLWWDILGCIVRCFPGVSADSYCKGWGTTAMDTVFDAPLAELERLSRISRSLVALDWNYNREIALLIRQVAKSAH